MIIPSAQNPSALAALRALLADGVTIRAAVAFVTEAGVDALVATLEPFQISSLEIVVRAADATTPEAVTALRDRLAADVSVVIGAPARRFHPKLWLLEHGETQHVLSGSGNLTHGGMITNHEQFEILTMGRVSDDAAEHHARFDRLVIDALALEKIEGAAIWNEWLAVIRKQAHLRRQLRDAEKGFLSRAPIVDRSADKAILVEDLQEIYDRTVAADLKGPSGHRYVPTRLLQGIRRARDGANDPVRLVTQVVRHRTGGFDVLLEENQVALTLENLVLDENKPYHDLFLAETLRLSRERVAMF